MKSVIVMLYLALGVGSLGAYSYVSATGWEYGSPPRQFAPKQVRNTQGGYRSFHFWHVGYGGYRGGK